MVKLDLSFLTGCFNGSYSQVANTEQLIDKTVLFHLLLLEPKLIDFVLMLMDPFQQVAFSFITKRTAKMLKSAHETHPTAKPILKFGLSVDQAWITLCTYSEPKVEWSILLEPLKKEDNPDSQTVFENILKWNWQYKERLRESRLCWRFKNKERYLQWTTLETIPGAKDLFEHLQKVYDKPRMHLQLESSAPEMERNEILTYFKGKGVEKYEYAIKYDQDNVLHQLLQQQEPVENLWICPEEALTANYDLKKLDVKSKLFIDYAFFITPEQIEALKSETVVLFFTNLRKLSFIQLVHKLKNELTPTWKRIFIQFNDVIDIDSVNAGCVVNVTNPTDISIIDRNRWGNMYKFQTDLKGYKMHVTGFHTLRKDDQILTVSVVDSFMAVIMIQPENAESLELVFDPFE